MSLTKKQLQTILPGRGGGGVQQNSKFEIWPLDKCVDVCGLAILSAPMIQETF